MSCEVLYTASSQEYQLMAAHSIRSLRGVSDLPIVFMTPFPEIADLGEIENVTIIKTEPNATYSNGRAPITYILEYAYPYSIDAVPLSYGSSQIARVNVNFYYSRHTVSYGDAQPGQIRIPVLP